VTKTGATGGARGRQTPEWCVLLGEWGGGGAPPPPPGRGSKAGAGGAAPVAGAVEGGGGGGGGPPTTPLDRGNEKRARAQWVTPSPGTSAA